MKSFSHLIPLWFIIHSVYGEEEIVWPCNLVKIANGNVQPLGVCLASSNAQEGVTSTQFVCNAEGTDVELRAYLNGTEDCTGDDPIVTELGVDAANFRCDAPGCPIFEWRAYLATYDSDADTCVKVENTYEEGVGIVQVCVAGFRATCDMNSLHINSYWEGENLVAQWADAALGSFLDSDHKFKLNCTAEVQSTTTLHEAGCFLGNVLYTEVMACSSAPCKYPLLLLTTIVFVISVLMN
eukprot:475081_1